MKKCWTCGKEIHEKEPHHRRVIYVKKFIEKGKFEREAIVRPFCMTCVNRGL